MEEFEQHKIQIFPGINDIPTAPSETEGSNISHMHEKFNNLIDSVITGNQDLDNRIAETYDYAISVYNNLYSYMQDGYYSLDSKIDNNSVTISNHTSQITELLDRVANLENNLLPQSEFLFENVTLVSDGNGNYKYDMTIPKTGNLINILLDDTWDSNDNSFKLDGVNIFTSESNPDDGNFIYAYNVGIYDQGVTENQTLTLISTNNDTALTKIRLKIV